jgi:hypothetical protein
MERRPPSAWNGVRDHRGTPSAISTEQRPGSRGIRRRRIKELERELRRKERALAEAAALLVLSKKVEAIFNKGEDE